MPKLRKCVQKIGRYKYKLRKLITRIGISYPDEFELNDELPKKLLLPCHLGILFLGEFDITLFQKIKNHLNQIYDSFFFDIKNLGSYNFSMELFSKGVKKEYKEMKKPSDKIKMHPTNKFYRILINKRIEENLGMIIAITDLPIYSSSNDNILFLFGETHLKHQCCVISSLKLKEQFYNRAENNHLFEQRIFKEIIHEIGHLIIGPDHCFNNSCVMRFSREVLEIDKKPFNFCNECRKKLISVREIHNF
jgi:predicted Zn-dependent protease